MQIDDIRKITIVGAGTMGQQIALQCAMYGYHVALVDVSPAALASAAIWLQRFADGIVKAGGLTPAAADAALARVTRTTDPAAAAQEADLLIEAVPENPSLKSQVFAQYHSLCPPNTIFTTNTSTLVPSMFAAATGRPAQFAAFHFHLPTWVSNVVDIMPHPGTDPAVVTLLTAFARRIGQIPIVLHQESHNYVFNAMLSALNSAALTLAATDVASVEDVDRAWMGVMKTPIGPFGIMDAIGLETIHEITNYWAGVLNDAGLRRNAAFVKGYLDQGRLGVKSGQGFYTYPKPAFGRPDFVAGEEDSHA